MSNTLNFIFPTTASLLWAGIITTIVVVSIISDMFIRFTKSQKQNITEIHHPVDKDSPQKELTLNRL